MNDFDNSAVGPAIVTCVTLVSAAYFISGMYKSPNEFPPRGIFGAGVLGGYVIGKTIDYLIK